ncbi:MAG: hypothetical protein MdMp024_0928 [Bacteroidales bacterium]
MADESVRVTFDFAGNDQEVLGRITDTLKGVNKESGDAFTRLTEGARQSAAGITDVAGAYDKLRRSLKGDMAGQSAGDIIQNITIQKRVVNELEAAVAQAKAKFDELNHATQNLAEQERRRAAQTDWQRKVRELNLEKVALKELQAEYDRKAKAEEKAAAAQAQKEQGNVSYLTQMRNIRQEMTQIVELSRQNGTNYQENERYKQLAAELEKVGTAYRVTRVQQQALISGATQIGGLLSGLSAISGAFSAAAGAMTLFGSKNENLLEVQRKLFAFMSITVGLQSIANTLHETSAFRVTTVAKATSLWNAAQKALNVQLGLSAALSKALMVSGIGLLIAGITALIVAYNKLKKNREELRKQNEEVAKKEAEISKSIADGYGSQVAKIEALRSALNSESVSQKNKLKIIKELQGIMPGYNAELNSEGKVIRENKKAIDEYLVSLEKAVKYKAVEKELMELYSQLYENEKQKNELATGFAAAEIDANLADWQKKKLENVGDSTIKAFDAAAETIKGKITTLVQYIQKEGLVDFFNDDNKTADRIAKTYASLSDLRHKQARERVRQEEDMQNAIEQTRIAAMEDGSDKTVAQLELNHKKEVQAWERQAEDMLQKKRDNARQLFNADSANEGKTFDASAIKLDENELKQLQDALTALNDKHTKETDDFLKNLIDKYQDYAKQREEIEKKYNADIKVLTDSRTAENAEATDRAIAQARKDMTNAIADLDKAFLPATDAITNLFKDMSRKSVSEMRYIAEQAQAMMDFVLSGQWDEEKAAAFGIKTKEIFLQLNKEWADSPEKLEAIKKAIRNLVATADDAETGLNKMAKALKTLFNTKTNATDFKKSLDNLASGLQDVTTLGNLFADSLRDIGELSGSEIFGDIAEGLSSVLDIAGSAMEGAQAGASLGGPVGAAVGAALGVVKSITSMLVAGKEQAEKNRQLTATMHREIFAGEVEVNRLYRERYEWTKKIGEAQLEYIARVGEELEKQLSQTSSEAETAWQKLQNQQYYARWDTGKRYGAFGIDALAKDVDAHWADPTSLKGLTEAEIELLYYQGRLTDEAKGYYEIWKAATSETAELEKQAEEYAETLRETFTGTSYSDIVNSIVDAFEEGKRSAEDFSSMFEDLMRGALSSALESLTDEKMRAWYEDLAKMGEDGFTEDEVTRARQSYLQLTEGISAYADALEKATGITLSKAEDESRTAVAKGIESISQDSADELNGRFTTLVYYGEKSFEKLGNINECLISGLSHLAEIRDNTRYCRRLEKIERYLANMDNNGLLLRK